MEPKQFETIDRKLDTIIDTLEDKPGKGSLTRTKNEILKALRGDLDAEEMRRGPSTSVRLEQVDTVKRILESAIRNRTRKSLNDACLEAWEPLTGGYPTPKALYVYCNANRVLFPVAD